MIDNKRLQFWLTALLTLLMSATGFALFHFGLFGYGYTFFIIIPLCIGYFLGMRPSWGISFLVAVIIGFVSFFYLLITAQLEWVFCVIILLPLFVATVIVGISIGYSLMKYLKKEDKVNKVKISIIPLIVLLFSGTIEHFFSSSYEYAKVESTIYLHYDASTVYDFIKSVGTLDGKKSLLMKLGLSVPQKCVLEKEEVGAKRICYFEGGSIEEKVIDIKRGEFIKMKVTDYDLPGFKWLKFDDAIYLFDQKGDSTKVTRITTYQSPIICTSLLSLPLLFHQPSIHQTPSADQ